MSIPQLFKSPLKVVNIGLKSFREALDEAQTPVVQVDWKPPLAVDTKAMSALLARPP